MIVFAALMALHTSSAWATSTLKSRPIAQSSNAHGDLPGPGPNGVHAIRSVEQWREFQTAQRLNWPIAVDFNRDMIVAVLLGTRNTGGYKVHISDVRATDWMIEVTYSEIPPQANQSVNQALTNPYVLSVIAQSQAPVVFSKENFGPQELPYDEYTRMIRQSSEMSYQLEDERRKNAMAQGRIQDLTNLLTRTSPPSAPQHN